MTLKSSILYSKIASQLGHAQDDDCRRINQLQDALISQGRWTPVGVLYVENEILKEHQHAEILRHHRLTNRVESDKVFMAHLVEHQILGEGAAEKTLERALEEAKEMGSEPIPITSAFVGVDWLDADLEQAIVDLASKVFDPMTHMTGYLEVLVQGRDDLTHGRLAFQLGYATREQLFAALHVRSHGEESTSLKAVLMDRGFLNELEDRTIRQTIDRFVPA